ncbi:MAG TPA: DUF2314 domain-containing protein [Steroidobacteraceae bacterium]|jgi:uncharacterized protein YegJ (DUF2314 family)
MSKLAIAMTLLLTSLTVAAFEPKLSKDAPVDKPIHVDTKEVLEQMHKATQPYVQQAKKTYPAAKQRFLHGLPPGETFFLTTRLHDEAGREEQVFIAVVSIDNGQVSGVINSPIRGVSGYSQGQPYSFQESELVDWLITKPDGNEEGNFVGKFLDTYQP